MMYVCLLTCLLVVCNASLPNIIFFLTDDQDQTLGGSFPTTAANGATPMPKAQELLVNQGAQATQFVIHTPICCPSRATTWTGRYLHNVKQPVSQGECGDAYAGQDTEGNPCCMHVDEVLVNNFTVARYLKEKAGYKTGLFGKYLNICPQTAPPGVDVYYANGGDEYYAPTFFVENVPGLPNGIQKNDNTAYSTALIGNQSVAWIKQVAQENKQTQTPFFAYIGTKAPHDPFFPAAWYRDTWDEGWPEQAPRTGNWNVSFEQLSGHHPSVSNRTTLIDQAQADCIDSDFKDRWRCILSVDDIVAEVIQTLDDAGVLSNTYFVFTSDHGYQLGQLNLNWDKRNVYESNIRIPLVVRGPGITPGSSFEVPATNVDLTPTLLAMAGITDLSDLDIDGRNFLPLLTSSHQPAVSSQEEPKHSKEAAPWRDHIFIEYYYVGLGTHCGGDTIESPDNNFIAVRHFPPSKFGNILYAEFQGGIDGNIPFDQIEFYELFDLDRDPWQLNNIYRDDSVTDATRQALHEQVQQWLHCKGDSCA